MNNVIARPLVSFSLEDYSHTTTAKGSFVSVATANICRILQDFKFPTVDSDQSWLPNLALCYTAADRTICSVTMGCRYICDVLQPLGIFTARSGMVGLNMMWLREQGGDRGVCGCSVWEDVTWRILRHKREKERKQKKKKEKKKKEKNPRTNS